MSRQGTIGQSVRLGAKFYDNGVLFDPLSISPVEIYNAPNGGILLATLDPIRVDIGHYQVVYNIPSYMTPTVLYDKWLWTAAIGMPSSRKTFSFDIVYPTVPPSPPVVIESTVCRPRPTWISVAGLRLIEDIGNGMSLNLTWFDAVSSSIEKELYYNIYRSQTRFGVFDGQPEYVTTDISTTIAVIPGKSYYVAVRASELNNGYFYMNELEQIGSNLYKYPSAQILQDNLDAYGVAVQVTSTEGYPSIGTILVGADAYGYELMKYNSKDATNFYVDDIDRGEFGTTINDHYIGENVNLWRGFEDGNTNIVQAVADWIQKYGPPRNIDAIGQPNVDSDGYRAVLDGYDNLTTDLEMSEVELSIIEPFSYYDFNSYHRPSLQDTFSGECIHSYVGGEFNGQRGFNLQDRILSQLDSVLQVTGEPVIILRRKWTGKRCRCISLNREHQRNRCQYCFGTSFEGGYDRLFNPRAISEKYRNDNGLYMLRVSPYTDDLEIVQDQGLRQSDEINMWTLTVPNIKDRDLVVRLVQQQNDDYSGSNLVEEFRYVVLNVTRNKLMFNKTGRQDIKMRRLDKTDLAMQYRINDPDLFTIA